MAASSVTFDSGNLENNIKELDRKFQRLILGEFIFVKDDAVSFAKINAPWTDDTGNARAGLFAEVNTDHGNSFELIMAHSVPYGIWLEVRWSGRYAIIMPTMNIYGFILMQRIQDILAKAGVEQ